MKVVAPQDETTDVPTYVQTYRTVSFTISGTLVAGVGVTRYYMPRAGVIVNVIASTGTAPTGQSAIFDLNKNGTTVFTTQANRPTITAGSNSDTSSVPDVTAFNAGDYFTVDPDQIGSTVAGADAVITIEYRVT